MMNTSVFEMVHQVLGDTREKLAQQAAPGLKKEASAQPQPSAPAKSNNPLSDEYLGKLASACDHLASNIHRIDHVRTPQEKLAEFVEINKALQKRAFEGGDKAHQTTEAKSDSVSPTTVTPNDTGTGVGQGNAIPSMPATTPGESMDAGESGEAGSEHQSPKSVEPNEKPTPTQTANALETNKDMMMPPQPEDLLNQSGGDESPGSKTASRVQRVLSKVSGQADREVREKIAAAKRNKVWMVKAAQSGIPQDVALALLKAKFAGDEENPAHIEAGTEPVLQSNPGSPSVLSQGSEAGVNTPRGSAPTSGEGGGRDILSSNESAMNATKREAKQQNKGALSELLTEPMQSAGHDHVLSESLDNTSSAGVKISAMRELLKKAAASSPKARQKIAMLAKKAAEGGPEGEGAPPIPPQGEAPAGPPAGPPPPPPPGGAPGMMPGAGPEMAGAAGPSEAALQAVMAGVTPEELAMAEELLAGEAGAAGAAEAPGAAPEAGAEAPEKVQNFGGAGGSGMAGPGGAAGGPPPASPMLG